MDHVVGRNWTMEQLNAVEVLLNICHRNYKNTENILELAPTTLSFLGLLFVVAENTIHVRLE